MADRPPLPRTSQPAPRQASPPHPATRHRSAADQRALAIARVRGQLIRSSFPRGQMTLMVALTGAFGLLASFVLLQLGLESMALRYPLALACAYVFFLFLVWLWLRTHASDYLEIPDVSEGWPRGQGGPAQAFRSGGGGDFGGGGAGGSFDGPADALGGDAVTAPLRAAGDAAGSVADADELAVPLLAIALATALAIGMALASLYVVYIAPVLFAEVLVDGALSYALLRQLRRGDPRHWLASVFRRTVLPFLATALFLGGAGAAMSAYAPGATSVGQVLDHR